MNPKECIRSLVLAALVFVLALTPALAWAGGKYKVLHNFADGQDAGLPSAPLTFGSDGNLFGTTDQGGTYGEGTVFELARQTGGQWRVAILHSFHYSVDGLGPGNVVLDRKGNIYGSTTRDSVVVFEMKKRAGNKWNFKVLDKTGGCCLVLDKSGKLYGAIGPGKYGNGAISELVHGAKGWTPKTLYSFCDSSGCPDGVEPGAPLSWDAASNLFGTTFFGGNGSPKCPGNLGCGVAFQMTPNSDGTWKYHVLHRFAAFPTDGQYPNGGLALDASGDAYGVTAYGGVHGNGTVFKLTPSSGGLWQQSVLYDFPNCDTGCGPFWTPVFDKAGNLYGVSSGGLADCQGYTCGVVFKLTPEAKGKWKYSVVHKFTGTDGGFPNGVTIDAKGNLYGTTSAFGAYGYGVAFEITP